MVFDFHYYLLNIQAGKELMRLPGSLVCSAPRVSNRLRKDDLLAILLTLHGGEVSPEDLKKLLHQMADAFYATLGSVTRAMLAACEEANRVLLEYNLERAAEGQTVEGHLNLAVLHKDSFFICHAGPTHSFVLYPERIKHFNEESPTKPIGASRSLNVQFYPAEAQPCCLVVFSTHPPETWTQSNLKGSSFLSVEQLRRRLLNQVTENLQALVVKAIPGNGKVQGGTWGEPAAEEEVSPPQATEVETAQSPLAELGAIPAVSPLADEEFEERAEEPLTDQVQLSQKSTALDKQEESEGIPVKPGQTEAVETKQTETTSPITQKPVSTRRLLKGKILQTLVELGRRLKDFVRGILLRVFPRAEGKEWLSPTLMTSLLILIPLVLVAVGLTVYTRSGREDQFNGYLELAQQYATLAEMQTDSKLKFDYWNQALQMVNKAEEYKRDAESSSLRQQAQTILDSLDLSQRLDFRPALTQRLPVEVNINSILLIGSDVYFLDAQSGSVLRAFFNPKGYYEVDSTFTCNPGQYGTITVGSLVDLVALPPNQPTGYKVLAIDENGNLLYCLPGELPAAQRIPSPSGGWEKLSGITLDNEFLYVLDSEKDEVLFYEPDEVTRINYASTPESFFDEYLPDLGGAIDFAVDGEDLYILHADGHMTTCQYSSFKDAKQTECDDPAPYTDNRLGREKNPWLFMDAQFVSMQATHVPRSSIYMLDGVNHSVYQFSYQLNLESLLKIAPSTTYPIPSSSATAFGVSATNQLFLALGNQLFFATLP